MGRGFTVVHMYPHQIKRVARALPPLPEEQTAIARFLDHATSRIALYIRVGSVTKPLQDVPERERTRWRA